MEVTANEKLYSVDEPCSIEDFLLKYCPGKTWVAVALNMNIIAKEEYAKTHLTKGDRLDIVHPVAGG